MISWWRYLNRSVEKPYYFQHYTGYVGGGGGNRTRVFVSEFKTMRSMVSIEVSISTNQSGHLLLKFWQFFQPKTGLAKQIHSVYFTRIGDFTWRLSDCEELVFSQEMMG